MKKFVPLLVIALVIVSLSSAFAGFGYEDPALCVNGQWLVVDSANATSVRIIVPSDAQYGDQAAGGCATPAPAPIFPDSVVSYGALNHALVIGINGRFASTPGVTVSYGSVVKTKSNDGSPLVFAFWVP